VKNKVEKPSVAANPAHPAREKKSLRDQIVSLGSSFFAYFLLAAPTGLSVESIVASPIKISSN